MRKQQLIEEYLSKAREAHAMADAFPEPDSFIKSSWLNIAQGYRDLAELEQAKGVFFGAAFAFASFPN